MLTLSTFTEISKYVVMTVHVVDNTEFLQSKWLVCHPLALNQDNVLNQSEVFIATGNYVIDVDSDAVC